MQSNFHKTLFEAYNAHPNEDWAWCPVLGGHIFPYMHGQATMNAIFGKIFRQWQIAKSYPSKPTVTQVLAWLKLRRQPRRPYKLRIESSILVGTSLTSW